mgnify:CR=1 FL=1
MGVIPPTKLLLVRNNVVQGSFSSYIDIVMALPIRIDDKGQITFNGEKVNPTYKMAHIDSDGWGHMDALKDWVMNYMGERKGYCIYRYLSY